MVKYLIYVICYALCPCGFFISSQDGAVSATGASTSRSSVTEVMLFRLCTTSTQRPSRYNVITSTNFVQACPVSNNHSNRILYHYHFLGAANRRLASKATNQITFIYREKIHGVARRSSSRPVGRRGLGTPRPRPLRRPYSIRQLNYTRHNANVLTCEAYVRACAPARAHGWRLFTN